MDLRQLIGLSGVPLIVLLVEITKHWIPDDWARFYPTFALAWGIILNVALALVLKTDLGFAAIVGLVAGAMAAKTFQFGKDREIESWTRPHG